MSPPEDRDGLAGQVESEYARLAEGIEDSSSLGRYLRWVKTAVLPRFVETDLAAILHQQRHQRVLAFIYGGAALVVGIVIMQTLFWPQRPELIWAEVILIGAMLLVQTADKRAQSRDRWMENRFLAEKLRFAAFTLIWEQEEDELSARRVSKSFLESGLRHGSWQEVQGRIDLSTKPAVAVAEEMSDVVALIRDKWLHSQRRYFEKTRERNHRALTRMERLGHGLLIVTILAAILHALGVGHHTPLIQLLDFFRSSAHGAIEAEGEHVSGYYTVGNLLIVLAILLPALSASMNAIKHSLEHHKLCLRASRALDGIEEFLRLLGRIRDPRELQTMVHDMDAFFMLEHEEWYALVSNKAVDVG